MPNWNNVLNEINTLIKQGDRKALDTVRRKYLDKLYKYTKRNTIAYYSGFLSKVNVGSLDINDEDKNGFMMAIHNLNRSKGLDLFLHTPGGDIAATQSVVDYLHKMFGKNIRVIVPQIAMSAGTMIACSVKEILMSKHSNLGPIDPHLGGIPAYGVKEEFRRACREVKKHPSRIPIWQSIIGQYEPTFLNQCESAITWSNKFVRDQLENVMFSGDSKAKEKAKKVVNKLTDYKGNKTHNRHIHFEECKAMGLNVKQIEGDATLQDLVLTVHHCFMHSIMNSRCYKFIENHIGIAFVRQTVA